MIIALLWFRSSAELYSFKSCLPFPPPPSASFCPRGLIAEHNAWHNLPVTAASFGLCVFDEHTHTHARTHARTRTHTHTHAHTHTRTHARTRTHTYTHTHAHAHTHIEERGKTDYSVAGEGVTKRAASEPFGMFCDKRACSASILPG